MNPPPVPQITLTYNPKAQEKYLIRVDEVRRRFKGLSFSQMAMMCNVRVILESPVENNYAVQELDDTYSLYIEGTLSPRAQRSAVMNLLEQVAGRNVLTMNLDWVEAGSKG